MGVGEDRADGGWGSGLGEVVRRDGNLWVSPPPPATCLLVCWILVYVILVLAFSWYVGSSSVEAGTRARVGVTVWVGTRVSVGYSWGS